MCYSRVANQNWSIRCGFEVPNRVRSFRTAVTLVELLVVIAIIGLLIGLLLPAVQAVRETARATQCRNNLRQLGIAAQTHHEQYRRFPTNGWGFRWVGDPDRGTGLDQPGGWIFNLLPFIEQQALHQRAFRLRQPDKSNALFEMLQVPVPVLYCPSRRAPRVGRYLGQFPLVNTSLPEEAAKSDYAGNGGDLDFENIRGPSSSDPKDVQSYQWPNPQRMSGIFFPRSFVSLADVRDGSSHCYLFGEKNVRADVDSITDPMERDIGDDQAAYIGDDTDIRRMTFVPPMPDTWQQSFPKLFGSAHRSMCHFVFCDGAVHSVSFKVDPLVHKALGNKADGAAVSLDLD